VTSLAFIAALGAAFFFGALPDVTGRIGENVTLYMIKSGADEDSLQQWFRNIGADWHQGIAWERGEAFGSPATRCSRDCDEAMQVAFTRTMGLCVVYGDRITMHFDKSRKLTDWSVEHSADGC
jgi:hypothetical protein